jgi:D-lactate dehydrogenase (cytochrome)
MLRQGFVRLPQPNNPRRWNGSASSRTHNHNDVGPSKPFWNTRRVLVFSAFASSLAYAYGVSDAGARAAELWRRERQPRYGTTEELKKAWRPEFTILSTTIYFGLFD